MSAENRTKSVPLGYDAVIVVSFIHVSSQVSKITCTSLANFLAIPLDFSYLTTGFFFKLRRTAIIPCTEHSSAAESHAFGEEPYKGFSDVGV